MVANLISLALVNKYYYRQPNWNSPHGGLLPPWLTANRKLTRNPAVKWQVTFILPEGQPNVWNTYDINLYFSDGGDHYHIVGWYIWMDDVPVHKYL